MSRVPDFTVRPKLWDAETRIGTIRRRHHKVVFPGRDEETTIVFCNNCGEWSCDGNCEVEELR